MHFARQLLHSLALACSVAAPLCAGAPRWVHQAGTTRSEQDLSTQRELIEQSNAARAAGDYPTARAIAAEVVTDLLGRPESEQATSWLELLDKAGRSAWDAQDVRTANRAWKRVLEIRSVMLAEDHPALQKSRQNLGVTLKALGDLAGARALQEKVLEVRSRTLPDDHPDLQTARLNLGTTLNSLGDLARARTLYEKVLDVWSRTLPDDHPSVQAARSGLGNTLVALGDVAGAHSLYAKVLEVRSRTLPDDHFDLQAARLGLGNSLSTLGDLAGARSLYTKVVEVWSRTLPSDHPDLQTARLNLGITLLELGDVAGARDLYEKVLEVRSRTLPDDHFDLQAVRLNLANALNALGDRAGARDLQESVLEVFSRTLPYDHPDLQTARLNLGNTLHALGDRAGARDLLEKVLELQSRTLPDDHPALQRARLNLGNVLHAQGDLAGSRDLQEKVLEVQSRTLPDDHPDLQMVRGNLGGTLSRLGDLAGARGLYEKVLEVRARTLLDDHPDLQAARLNLGNTLAMLGDLAGARDLSEQALEGYARTLPDDHPDVQAARLSLLLTLARLAAQARVAAISGEQENTHEAEHGRRRFGELALAFTQALHHATLVAISDASSREAEERVSSRNSDLAISLSVASGLGVFAGEPAWEAAAFVASESMRSAALASARIARAARGDSEYDRLRSRARRASDELARAARAGASADEFTRVRTELDLAQRELVRRAAELSGGRSTAGEMDLESLTDHVHEREAFVAYRRYSRKVTEAADSARESSTESLCAFVVRRSDTPATNGQAGGGSDDRLDRRGPALALTRIELGAIAPIEAAVERWRSSLGTSAGRGLAAAASPATDDAAAGTELRALVLDPLFAHLVGVERVIFVLDDVLHGAPLDALPAGEVWAAPSGRGEPSARAQLFGDCVRVELRSSLLEFLTEEHALESEPALVALGGADFGVQPSTLARRENAAMPLMASATEMEVSASVPVRSASDSGPLRGSAWEQGFTALPGTLAEARALKKQFVDLWGETSECTLLESSAASRDNLFEFAPKARFLHLATHGWFAPESVKSTDDPEPLDKLSGLGPRLSREQRVRGMSPMLLCGLALAGANLPATATGRIPGLVTAQELSMLDLTNCELAVVSACDTNVGVRRAGQGVASLQRALHMAGARSVITSLWNVPDEATKELMVDFYRRIWVEKKPKAQALWEAKTKLRDARDERREPKYTTRDWAAWVLTGDPQ